MHPSGQDFDTSKMELTWTRLPVARPLMQMKSQQIDDNILSANEPFIYMFPRAVTTNKADCLDCGVVTEGIDGRNSSVYDV